MFLRQGPGLLRKWMPPFFDINLPFSVAPSYFNLVCELILPLKHAFNKSLLVQFSSLCLEFMQRFKL